MTITNGYATATQLNKRIGKNYQFGDGFSLLEDSIEAASRFIDEFTNRFFYTKTLSSEKVDIFGDSDNGLYLSPGRCFIRCYAPFISVTTITEGGTTLTADQDYYVYLNDGKISKVGRWSGDRKAIQVTGSIGYASTPKEINQICLTVAEVFSGLGIRSYVDENGAQIDVIQRSVPKWVFDRLKMYKHIRVQ